MSTSNLEDRVTVLEEEVARLGRIIRSRRQKKGWRAIVGTFKDDPLYEKAMKYGREYRESLRPKGTYKAGKKQ